jgi:hypothetical protein
MLNQWKGINVVRPARAYLKQFLIVLILIGLFSIFGAGTPVLLVSAVSNCVASGPTSGAYTATVCFSSPTTTTLGGNVVVTATVSVTGTNPGIQRMTFYLDNAYLITDYLTPYTFTLPTTRWVDGNHTIAVAATMRDAFITSQSVMATTFLNGITTPPVNQNSFTPALGTNPANGSPLVVAAVGDGASGETNSTSVVNLISSWNPNLFLFLGDVYEKGSVTEFYNWYGNTTQNYGLFRTITDPTIGNHEYEFGVAPGYFDYWNNIPNYYSFNSGGWHFISLNANSQFNQTSTTSAQYKWLVQDLASITTACTLVYYHQPLYNIGAEPPQTKMQQIWSLLAQSKVDIVLNGHDHDYQRWVALDGSGVPNSNGITEFVVGAGGHGVQTFTKTDSRVASAFDATTNPKPYGALRLKLFTASAGFDYINISGTVLDTGTINCHNAVGIPTPPPTPTNTPTNTPTPTATSIPPAPTNPPTPTATSAPSVITLSPAADAYVDSTSSTTMTTNNGTKTTLRADASPDLHSYLKFNVQGLTGPVTSAKLWLFANSGLSSPGVSVRGVADTSWVENTINFNNAPAIDASVTGSSGQITALTWTSIDVTSLINGNGLVSLAVTNASSTNISLASREAANAPQLVIQN